MRAMAGAPVFDWMLSSALIITEREFQFQRNLIHSTVVNRRFQHFPLNMLHTFWSNTVLDYNIQHYIRYNLVEMMQ